jgi:hypothetical protein
MNGRQPNFRSDNLEEKRLGEVLIWLRKKKSEDAVEAARSTETNGQSDE